MLLWTHHRSGGVALLSLSLLLGGGACGDGDPAFGETDLSSGDEVEADGIAMAMPSGSSQPALGGQGGVVAPPASSEPTILRPDLEDIPSVGASAPPPPPTSGSSEWGDPESESGTPLPERSQLSGGAVSAYQRGIQLAARGDLNGAKSALEEAYRADPKSAQVLVALGIVADRSGQANQALGYYRKALSYQPDYERAVDGAVKMYVRSGNPTAAVRFAEPVARSWERNLELQAVYGDALIAAKRYEEAERVARAALRRDERHVPAMIVLARASLARGRQELAASIIEQAAGIDSNHPELLFMQGQAAAKEDRVAEALEAYRKAVKADPEYAEARTALGMQYMAGGNYAQALTEFEAAAKLVPMVAAAHLNLGDAYRANKRWPDAKREFDLALRMDAKMAAAHYNLALMYMTAGDAFPGLSTLDALQKAVQEFNEYRSVAGARAASDDGVDGYLEDLTRQIEREQKRLEREARAKARSGG